MPDVLARLRLAGRDWPPLTSSLLGESVTVEAVFTDAAGAAVEVSTVTAIAYRPAATGESAGTTPAITLTRMGVGVWAGALLLDRVGDWAIQAQCTGPSAAVARADLRVSLGGPEALGDSRGAASAAQSASTALEAAVRAELAAAQLVTFDARAAFVTAVAGSLPVTPGVAILAGGLRYLRVSGATVIPDLPGFVPLEPTLRHWGCVGNGTADDTARIVQALAAGLPLDGERLTYGVTGTVDLPGATTLRDATFRQLAPAASTTVITLRSTDVSNLTLQRVKVDKNGDGSNGGLAQGANGLQASCIAILISGGVNHRLEDLEVWGNDSCTGIRFVGLNASSAIIRPYVHDMMAQVPGAEDDVVQGIVFQTCIGMKIDSPRVARLSWRPDANTPPAYMNSRAIAFSGCDFCTIEDPGTEDSGQGVDMTGNLGNGNRWNGISGGRARRHATWGFKLANLSRGNRIFNAVAEDCVSAGFVDSSSFDDPVDDGDANRVVQCGAINCGKSVGSSAAFLKLNGQRAFTNLMTFERCWAIERRVPAEMAFGFRCEPGPRGTAIARAIDCISIGHTQSAKSGFADDLFVRGNVASQGAAGAVTYINGSGVLLPPPSTFSQGGRYLFRCRLSKTAAGTGNPRIQLRYGAADLTSALLGEGVLAPQTAEADRAELEVIVVFRQTGAGALVAAGCKLLSNLGTGGFAAKAVQIQDIDVAAFDATVDGAYLGVAVNPGGGATWQISGAHALLDLAGRGA